MLNELIIAGVNNFTSGKSDKNGKEPIILNVVAGKFPNRNVLSGTVAENLGVQVGKSYIFQVREVESNAYGRQFVYTVVSEINGLDLIKATKELGMAQMIEVDEKLSSTDIFANTTSEFETKK